MAALREPDTLDGWIARFRQAGKQRCTTAERLHAGQMHIEAMYLAGYGVECALKSLILHDTPRSKRGDILQKITKGIHAHNYENLRAIYQSSTGTQFPKDGNAILIELVQYQWSTAYRYAVGDGDPDEAKAFLKEVKNFILWVERRLT
jgi:TPR repeat protein